MSEQRYSENHSRKDFMINQNESDLHRPGIEPRARFTVREFTGRQSVMLYKDREGNIKLLQGYKNCA
jgi:hypothetical protein